MYISLLATVVLGVLEDGRNKILQNFDTYIPIYCQMAQHAICWSLCVISLNIHARPKKLRPWREKFLVEMCAPKVNNRVHKIRNSKGVQDWKWKAISFTPCSNSILKTIQWYYKRPCKHLLTVCRHCHLTAPPLQATLQYMVHNVHFFDLPSHGIVIISFEPTS